MSDNQSENWEAWAAHMSGKKPKSKEKKSASSPSSAAAKVERLEKELAAAKIELYKSEITSKLKSNPPSLKNTLVPPFKAHTYEMTTLKEIAGYLGYTYMSWHGEILFVEGTQSTGLKEKDVK